MPDGNKPLKVNWEYVCLIVIKPLKVNWEYVCVVADPYEGLNLITCNTSKRTIKIITCQDIKNLF